MMECGVISVQACGVSKQLAEPQQSGTNQINAAERVSKPTLSNHTDKTITRKSFSWAEK